MKTRENWDRRGVWTFFGKGTSEIYIEHQAAVSFLILHTFMGMFEGGFWNRDGNVAWRGRRWASSSHPAKQESTLPPPSPRPVPFHPLGTTLAGKYFAKWAACFRGRESDK